MIGDEGAVILGTLLKVCIAHTDVIDYTEGGSSQGVSQTNTVEC